MSTRLIICWLAILVIFSAPCPALNLVAFRSDGRIDSHVWDMLDVEEACAAYQDAMSGCGSYESARKHLIERAAVAAITANSIELATYTEEEKFIQPLVPPPIRLQAGGWTCNVEATWRFQSVVSTTAVSAIQIGDCQVAVAMARLLLSHSRAFGVLPLEKDNVHLSISDRCAMRALVILRNASVLIANNCVADGWNAMIDHQILQQTLHADQYRGAVRRRQADAFFPRP